MKELISELEFKYKPYLESKGDSSQSLVKKCANCGRCTVVCPYSARTLNFPNMEVCRSCGMCVSVCPTGALISTIAKQAEKHKILEKASADFYASF